MANYNETYVCSGCSTRGVKLWRDYSTFASNIQLKCATCATPDQLAYDAKNTKLYGPPGSEMSSLDEDGVFTFRDGDQLGGLVPAVTTEDGETFWGYSSVPPDRVEWWHSMPMYRDDARELRCLRTLLRRSMAQANDLGERWLKSKEEIADLNWRLEREVYTVTSPIEITIWGNATMPASDGLFLRYGEAQPRSLAVGSRIAVHHGRALLVLGETRAACPSINVARGKESDGSVETYWMRRRKS